MKQVPQLIAKVVRGIGFALAICIGMIGWGAVRQLMTITECAPGKPVMSLTAFIEAGFIGPVCTVPRR